MGSRSEIYYHQPTEKWLQGCDPPLVKKEILAWYEREKKVLDLRLRKSVKRTFECTTVIVHRETKIPIKKAKKARQEKIEKWRLSQKDHDLYRRWLDARFEKIKARYNQEVKRKKQEKQNGQ